MLRFQLLGPIELWNGDRQVDLGPARQRNVLAALLIDPGRPISIGRLVERVWADSPPEGVRNVVYTYITRLRRALALTGDSTIQLHRDNVGYRLTIAPEQVDLHRFRSLLHRARATTADDPGRGTLLREALRLWRGEALAGLDNEWAARFRQALHHLKHEALAEWADAELRAGRGAGVIPELRDALVQEPLAELLHEQLVRALHHTGQRAEALSQYERARRIIAEELGSDPSPGLQEAYQCILNGRPVVPQPAHRARPRAAAGVPGGPAVLAALPAQLTAAPPVPAAVCPSPPAPSAPAAPGVTVAERRGPDLLPVDVADFCGRDHEVDYAYQHLTAPGTLPPLLVLVGGAGVGKSALAVHVAHRAAHHFPHARLYLDLRGSHGRPVSPVLALTRLLRALGEDVTGRIDDLDELAEAYRNRVSQKRVLVVLDDAADEAQVAPLLPSGPHCAALVTSRFLSTRPVGARVCRLAGLSEERSVELLARMIGCERVAAEEWAARRLAELCTGLPLALRAVANRLMARPHWTLSRLLTRLADESRRLDELSYGSLSVRARLHSTYRRLPPTASAAFRRLGRLSAARAVLANEVLPELSPEEAEDMLEYLVEAHLLHARGRDSLGRTRYQLDELHRPFARLMASASEIRR